MNQSPLARIPFLGKFVDERFLEHRRRSTSVAGIVGALVALVFSNTESSTTTSSAGISSQSSSSWQP